MPNARTTSAISTSISAKPRAARIRVEVAITGTPLLALRQSARIDRHAARLDPGLSLVVVELEVGHACTGKSSVALLHDALRRERHRDPQPRRVPPVELLLGGHRCDAPCRRPVARGLWRNLDATLALDRLASRDEE